MITFFYENPNAKTQMNELGLFDFFKNHKVIKIEKSKVFFNSFYLSGMNNGKTAGRSSSDLSFERLAVNFPELRAILNK